MRKVTALLVCVALCRAVGAQSIAEQPARFAVATIKPSAADAAPVTQFRGNRFASEGTTFVDLFKYAYNVHPDQVVGGPEWLRTKKFDVLADPETEKRPSSDQMKALVRQLLAERFHVVMHQEQKVLPVYALVKTPDAPKLKKSTADPSGIPVAGYSPTGELQVGNATMGDFVRFLQRFVLDRPAVDQTGIEGKFDLVLKWTPDGVAGDAAAPPSLFTAVREQLGLKLQAVKAKTDVFVVERAEMPAEN